MLYRSLLGPARVRTSLGGGAAKSDLDSWTGDALISSFSASVITIILPCRKLEWEDEDARRGGSNPSPGQIQECASVLPPIYIARCC